MPVPRLGTQEHNTLLTLVKQRMRQSENLLQARHARWRETERSYRVFVDPDQVQGPVEATSDEAQLLHPYPTSVVIPMTYAIAQTLIAFYVSLFSNQVPYLRVGNRTPESAGAAKGQELLISYQLDMVGWPMLLYQWLLDSFRYGVGIVKHSWKIDERMMTVKETEQVPLLGQMFAIQTDRKRPVIHYEGNWSEVVDPFTWRPDPRQPIAKFQEGLYCGESLYRSYFDVLRSAKGGMYDEENVRMIPRYTLDGLGSTSARGTFAQSDRDRITQVNTFFGEQPTVGDAGMVVLDPVIIDIIPRELGIGESSDIERWLVTVANASVVIRAEEYPYQHQDFYYSIIESSPDLHSMLNPGTMEMMEPLAQQVSWLYNCVSFDTDILTEAGWKPVSSITQEDRVATVHPVSRDLWFEHPKQVYRYDYQGDLVEVDTWRFNAAVTPNHKMWVKRREKKGKRGQYQFLEAQQLLRKSRVSVWGHVQWGGEEEGELRFAGKEAQFRKYTWYRDRWSPRHSDVCLPYSWLAPFLGWYVSEGSCTESKGNYAVAIGQKKPAEVARIDALMQHCPMKVSRSARADGAVRWVIYDKRLSAWIKEHCGAGSQGKKLPAMVRDWSPALLAPLVAAALAGDGMQKEGGGYIYTTTSQQLADDLQICCLKIGWNAFCAARVYSPGRTRYDLNIDVTGKDYVLGERSVTVSPYAGKVYCVENSTHLTIYRRQGKIAIMGQSHIENVRKVLNDQLIVDPSKIEIDDLLNPGPGRLIRLRPEYQGTSVQDAVTQLQVQDVTGQNVQTASVLIDLLQRLSAANDQIQGQESDTRKTATEVTMATNMASGRLRTLAKVYATQGIVPMGRQYAQNNMSFMSTEQYVRIAGSLENEYRAIGKAVQGGTMLRPEDIQGLFDFPLVDPSQPLDPVRWAQTWMQISQMAVQSPVLQQAVDHVGLFKQVTQSMGVSDVSRFLLQQMPQNVQVMPDQQMQQEVQKGNLVGIGGGAGLPQPPQPGQMNGGGPIQ